MHADQNVEHYRDVGLALEPTKLELLVSDCLEEENMYYKTLADRIAFIHIP